MRLIGCELNGLGLPYDVLRYRVYLVPVVPVQRKADQSGGVAVEIQLQVDHAVAAFQVRPLVAVQDSLVAYPLAFRLGTARQLPIQPPEGQLAIPPVLGVEDGLAPLLVEAERLPCLVLIELQPEDVVIELPIFDVAEH